MQDGSNIGDAVGRGLDGGESANAVERRSYAELPDRSKKWPKPARVLFIAGSAAALWGLLFAAIRLL